MAHYAYLDKNNVVISVFVGKDETELIDGVDTETYYQAKRTSYNNRIRFNFAGVGYSYDEVRNAFIAPKPFDSWVLDEATCQWNSPIAYPSDGKDYCWNEESLSWVALG